MGAWGGMEGSFDLGVGKYKKLVDRFVRWEFADEDNKLFSALWVQTGSFNNVNR